MRLMLVWTIATRLPNARVAKADDGKQDRPVSAHPSQTFHEDPEKCAEAGSF